MPNKTPSKCFHWEHRKQCVQTTWNFIMSHDHNTKLYKSHCPSTTHSHWKYKFHWRISWCRKMVISALRNRGFAFDVIKWNVCTQTCRMKPWVPREDAMPAMVEAEPNHTPFSLAFNLGVNCREWGSGRDFLCKKEKKRACSFSICYLQMNMRILKTCVCINYTRFQKLKNFVINMMEL